MSKVNGKDAILYKYNETTLEWVPFGCARSITLDISREMVETSISGNGIFKTYVPGAGSVTGTIEGIVFIQTIESTLVTMKSLYDLIIGGTVFNIKYYENDIDGVTYLQKELTVILESLNETASFDNMVTFSANFRGIGAPIVTTGTDIPRVTIGSRTWSTENFAGETYVNGDNIPQATNQTDWNNYAIAETGAWCYYQFNPDFANFGKLYNYHVVNDARGVGYPGWHVPNDDDSDDLLAYITTNGAASLLSDDITYWEAVNGTNASGLTLIGSGFMNSTSGGGKRQEFKLHIKTLDLTPTIFTIDLNLSYNVVTVDPANGYSIRLVQD